MKGKANIFFLFFFHFTVLVIGQNAIKGIVVEPDSITPMPFVYVINSQSGHGQMSDGNGRFTVIAKDNDTIIFSFVGYVRLKIPASNIHKNGLKESRIVMQALAYKLNQVVVSSFKLKPYERDYMKRVIDDSKTKPINAMESPISALYMQFSKKGKEQRKLAAIFEEIFIKEAVEKKFNAEVLRKLTGDDTIDFDRFKKYCFYLSNEFIMSHEGYELYYRVMDCYYRWKEENR